MTAPEPPAPELTTVADDEAVVHVGMNVRTYRCLEPDTAYQLDGLRVRTLPRPGEELCRVATVNDVHLGETVCGVLGDDDSGPLFRSEPGADPYPVVTNRSVVGEIAALDPAAVVAKGDLTADGTRDQYQAFLDLYEPAFGDRLVHFRGNHDGYAGETFADNAPLQVDLPGVILALIDTVIPGETTGAVGADQLGWLDDVAAESDRPVLVLGHHHVWGPDEAVDDDSYFGVRPADSRALVDLVARRPAIVGYAAGHTHRNRIRELPATGTVPWAEVACVKDYPVSWVEYRVFDGGILQLHRRASTTEALAWSEQTRHMFGGFYADYALGRLSDRCRLISLRQ